MIAIIVFYKFHVCETWCSLNSIKLIISPDGMSCLFGMEVESLEEGDPFLCITVSTNKYTNTHSGSHVRKLL